MGDIVDSGIGLSYRPLAYGAWGHYVRVNNIPQSRTKNLASILNDLSVAFLFIQTSYAVCTCIMFKIYVQTIKWFGECKHKMRLQVSIV
jgi:hypothetical protein